MISSIRKRYFGDKKFYLMVLAIAVPIMIQNGITNFVNLLDNIMVGRIGTEQMTGVAIVNQLIFVYNLCIFGGMSGAGIFTAQYYGNKDHEGIASTFRYKFLLGVILTVLALLLFLCFGQSLIQLYLNGNQDGGDPAAALRYGWQYMLVIIISLPAFMLVQNYASTLRECGQTVVPMKAGLIAVAINLIFNYLLIYGKLGFPELGVIGAAIATTMSRYIEALIVMIWTHCHSEEHPFIRGIYKSFKIPGLLAKKIVIKGTPLLLNETLWSLGIAMLLQCYSIRGMNVVAGMNIANTITNLFNIVFLALGSSVSIVVGQILGAGKMDEARETARKMIVFSVLACTVVAIIMFCTAPLFPKMYNTSPLSRQLAGTFIAIAAVFMPQSAFLHAAYFTIRSGGKTLITFFFDCGFMILVSVPLAFCLGHFTSLDIIYVYILVTAADFIKCIIGYILIKKGIWLHNLVA